MRPKVPDTTRILLEEKARLYNAPSFIQNDPVQIPHLFSEKENIEISGFLAAMLAWGRRDIIIRNAEDLVRRMDNRPIDFLMNAQPGDLEVFRDFRHRTFSGEDCMYFMQSLQNIYMFRKGLYHVFLEGYTKRNRILDAISGFHRVFFELQGPRRTRKHIADPSRGSAAKRINLFLRWMVRKDQGGVDFGIWDRINPADLYIPLDVHTGKVARELGLLQRKQNDWKAVEELTGVLRQLDPGDPVRYDYALFGLGISKDL